MTISSGIRIRKYPWQWKGEYCISDDKSLLVNTICPMLELKKTSVLLHRQINYIKV